MWSSLTKTAPRKKACCRGSLNNDALGQNAFEYYFIEQSKLSSSLTKTARRVIDEDQDMWATTYITELQVIKIDVFTHEGSGHGESSGHRWQVGYNV